MPPSVARIVLAYDGTDFHGWQIQPNLRTVQGELIAGLKRLIDVVSVPPGAGRTDAGVHAWGQVSSVTLAHPDDVIRLTRALPHMMPDDIVIRSIVLETSDFHARHSACGRHYRYRMLTLADPSRRRSHLNVGGGLDLEAMVEAASSLVGDHDCTSLCRRASLEPGRTRCVIHTSRLTVDGDELVLDIAADRFLHSMVRTIVGTLLDVGQGRRRSDCFSSILSAMDRGAAGPTAAPHGLYLHSVKYDSECSAPPEDHAI